MTAQSRVVIREAEAKDAVAAAGVLRRSIIELCEVDHRNDVDLLRDWLRNKTPDQFKVWLQRPNNSILVAVEEERILAVGAVMDSGEINLNYVNPDARFRGVSKVMLSALEQRAVNRGCSRVTLTSTQTARRFYLAAGYVESAPPEARPGRTSGYPMVKTSTSGAR